MAIQLEDYDVPSYAEVASLPAPEAAYEDPSSLVKGATLALQQGEQTAVRLQKLIDVRGRGSDNAAACRTLVSDYLFGLDDLRTVLAQVEAGDLSAAQRIPGIVTAIQESFDFDTILSKMKAYTNKKDGTRALPAYVREVCMELSGSFQNVFESVRPLSEVLDVQAQVRNRVNTVGNYKFHETKMGNVSPSTAAERPVVQEPVQVSDFSPAEKTWFNSKPADHYEMVSNSTPQEEVQAASGGFFKRVMGTLGGLASSVASASRNIFPKAALAGLVLSLGGCGPQEDSAPELRPLPVLQAPINVARPLPPLQAPVMPTFQVDENAPNLWKAISGELAEECGLKGGQLQRETGKLVRESFETQNVGYKTLAQGLSAERQDAAKTHLSSSYGIAFADTTDGIFKSTVQTGNLGAVNMENGPMGEITLWGNAVLEDYSCPVLAK